MWDPDDFGFLVEEDVEMPLPGSSSEDDDEYEDEEDSEDEEESEEEAEEGVDEVGEVTSGDMGAISSPGALYGDNQNDSANLSAIDAVHTMSAGLQEVLTVDDDVASVEKDVTDSLTCMDDLDGLFCPICYEAWTCGGDHHVCCLPCGHIYGLSCIKKWLQRRGSSKCPQCKKKCGIRDIRLLFASRIVAVDEELQKKVRSLEAKCAALQKKDADMVKKEAEWKKKEVDLSKQLRYLKERTRDLEGLLGDMERRASGSSASTWDVPTMAVDNNINFHLKICSGKLSLQKDFQVDGARFFDVDSTSKIFVVARRLLGMAGVHVLTKMSFLSDHVKEDISLPDNTKAVKDLRVSPHDKLVLLASLGKRLSILSTESNATIVTFKLPAAAWSCSWDVCSPHYVYAGLQNGTALLFDRRQVSNPVESLTGLSGNPIHSLQSLSPNSSMNTGVRSVLTASSLGLCQWNFGGNEERPHLIPESENQGVCISMAWCSTSEHIVASYRPKVAECGDFQPSQMTLCASSSVPYAQSVRGTHVYYRRIYGVYQNSGATSCNVSDIRLPKSTIMGGQCGSPLFASGDEATGELLLHELPSLMVVDRVQVRRRPIRDVKYTQLFNSGLLCCLSDDSLQLFGPKPL